MFSVKLETIYRFFFAHDTLSAKRMERVGFSENLSNGVLILRIFLPITMIFVAQF